MLSETPYAAAILAEAKPHQQVVWGSRSAVNRDRTVDMNGYMENCLCASR